MLTVHIVGLTQNAVKQILSQKIHAPKTQATRYWSTHLQILLKIIMTAWGTNASAAHQEVTSNNNYDIIRGQYELAYSKTRSHDECHDPETSAATGYRPESIQVSIDTINICVHQRAGIRIVQLDSSIQLIRKYTRATIIKQLPKHRNSILHKYDDRTRRS